MSSLPSAPVLAASAPGVLGLGLEAPQRGATPYTASALQAAAALVHLSGVSSVTVDQFEASLPANLAAAAALVDQVASSARASSATADSLYTLMDPSVALALTLE